MAERKEKKEKPVSSGRRLDSYPGMALVVDTELAVIAANSAAEGFLPLLADGGLPKLRELVGAVSRSGAVMADSVALALGESELQLDVTLVPQDRSDAVLILARDVTLERNLRPALIESRQRYKDLVEISSDFAWEVGPEGTFVFVSARSVLGFDADELIGRRPDQLVVDSAAYRPLPFLSDQPLENVELWMRRLDDTLACVMVSSRPIRDEAGNWLGARGVCRDVTRERERETALMRARHREQILHYVVRAIRNEVDPQNMLAAAAAAAARALSAAGCRIYRLTAAGVFAAAAEFGNNDDLQPFEAMLAAASDVDGTLQCESGAWRILGAVTDYRAAINGGMCIWKTAGPGPWTEDDKFLVSDIADQLGIAIEQINNHERIVRLSRTDALTGLLNRRAFYDEEMPRRLNRLRRTPRPAALYYVDLDNFKQVNDMHGHQRGDEALVTLRDLLLEHSRPGDLIARIGGDEFVMWMEGIEPDVAELRARELVEAAVRLTRYSGSEDDPLGISLGVAVHDPTSEEGLDEILARADDAMYSVKRRGKGGFQMAVPAAR